MKYALPLNAFARSSVFHMIARSARAFLGVARPMHFAFIVVTGLLVGGCDRIERDKEKLGYLVVQALQLYNFVFDKPAYCMVNFRQQFGNFLPALIERQKTADKSDVSQVRDVVKFMLVGLERLTIDNCPVELQTTYLQTISHLRQLSTDWDRNTDVGFFSGKTGADIDQQRRVAAGDFQRLGNAVDKSWEDYFKRLKGS